MDRGEIHISLPNTLLRDYWQYMVIEERVIFFFNWSISLVPSNNLLPTLGQETDLMLWTTHKWWQKTSPLTYLNFTKFRDVRDILCCVAISTTHLQSLPSFQRGTGVPASLLSAPAPPSWNFPSKEDSVFAVFHLAQCPQGSLCAAHVRMSFCLEVDGHSTVMEATLAHHCLLMIKTVFENMCVYTRASHW